MDKINPVIFRIDDRIYGVDINKVQAIELYNDIVPVPNAVDCVDGLINIRGEVIPVYNLRKRNKSQNEDFDIKEEQFILVNCKGELLALMVDNVEDIRDIKGENYQALPTICKNEENKYIMGIAHLDIGLAIIIDVEMLLTDKEVEILNKVVDK